MISTRFGVVPCFLVKLSNCYKIELLDARVQRRTLEFRRLVLFFLLFSLCDLFRLFDWSVVQAIWKISSNTMNRHGIRVHHLLSFWASVSLPFKRIPLFCISRDWRAVCDLYIETLVILFLLSSSLADCWSSFCLYLFSLIIFLFVVDQKKKTTSKPVP